MPQVLNNRKHHIPPQAVYIGRPSRWGNPFPLGDFRSREECLAAYAEWLFAQPELIEAIKRELRGKDLVCYCAPKACHGDLLLKIANA